MPRRLLHDDVSPRLCRARDYLHEHRAEPLALSALAFEVRHDVTMGGFRGPTVGPKGQPDLEPILIRPQPGPMVDEVSCNAILDLVRKGAFGAGVLATADRRKTFEELKARGVEFVHPPGE